jgi:hypothetical protein
MTAEIPLMARAFPFAESHSLRPRAPHVSIALVRGIQWRDGGMTVRIATRRARRDALLSAVLVPVVALVFVFGGDESGDSGVPLGNVRTNPGLAAYVIAVGVIGVFLLVRAFLVTTELSPSGIVVRNLLRTYRVPLAEVRSLGERRRRSNNRSAAWVTAISRTTDDAPIECAATRTRDAGRAEIAAALQTFATARGLQVDADQEPEKSSRVWTRGTVVRGVALVAVAIAIGALVAIPLVSSSSAPTMAAYARGKVGTALVDTSDQFRAIFPTRPQRSVTRDPSTGLTLTTYTSTVADGGISVSIGQLGPDTGLDITPLEGEAKDLAPGTILTSRNLSFAGLKAFDLVSHDAAHGYYDENLSFISHSVWFDIDVLGASNPPAGYRRFVDSISVARTTR